jgi:hypothetical protein
MKPTFESDDLVATFAAVKACELDCGFIGLRTGIAKERLAAKTPFRQHLGPHSLRFHVPRIGNVNQCRNLFLHCLNHAARAMPEQVTAPAREKI